MLKMRHFVIHFVIFAIGLPALLARAQTTAPATPPQETPVAVNPDNDPALRKIKAEIAPSDAQMEQIIVQYQHLRTAQRDLLREARRQTQEARATGSASRAQVMEAIRHRMDAARTEFIERVQSLLRDDQKIAWEACSKTLDLMPRIESASGATDTRTGPAVDDEAPAFELKNLDGKAVSLRSLRGKPTVIEFGSYTCPIYRGKVAALQELRKEFGDMVNWILIYTREAHPSESRAVPANTRDGISIRQHTTIEQRIECATLNRKKTGDSSIVLIDDMKNTVSELYAGWPNRGFVIDAKGKVVSKQAWIDAEKTRAALQALLTQSTPN